MKTVITINGPKTEVKREFTKTRHSTYINKKGEKVVYTYKVNDISKEDLKLSEDWKITDNGIEYRKVPGYKAIASSNGRLWHYVKTIGSVKESTYSKANKYGYIHGFLNSNDGTKQIHTTLQRIIAYTFGLIDEIKYDGNDIDHIDGNYKNNSIDNLRVIPHDQNIRKRDFCGNALNKPIALFDKETDELVLVFKSSRECAKYLSQQFGTGFGTACVSVCNALKGKLPTYRGYKYRYMEIK